MTSEGGTGPWARAGAGIRVTRERLQPLGTVGGFIALGLAVFALIPLWAWSRRGALAAGAFVMPGIVALVHLYVIGWGTAVALGALQQLSNVVFQPRNPVAPRYSIISLALFGLGLVPFFTGLITLRYALTGVGGTLLFAAFAVTAGVVVRSVRTGERASVVTMFVAPAVLSLLGVAVVGALIAFHRVTGLLGDTWTKALASHLYLGPLGWFGLLIPGISYELAPFFGLTRGGEEKGLGRYPGWVAGLLLAGLVGGLVLALAGRFRSWALLPLASGYLLYVYDLRGIYRARPLIRRTATLTGVRSANAYLVAAALMLAAGGFVPGLWGNGRWLTTLGWLALAGWLSCNVVGYLHRILPFVAWHNRYWGKEKELIRTRFQDMVDQRLGRMGFYVYNAGVVLVAAGLWAAQPVREWLVAVGILFVALGSWVLVFNLGRVYVR